MPAVAVWPASAVVKSADGGATIPRAAGSSAARTRPSGRRTSTRRISPGPTSVGQTRIEVGLACRASGRPVPRSSGDRLLEHEQADERGVGADRRVERGGREVGRDHHRLGDRGQPDDDQEDPVDEDQQDGSRDAARAPRTLWPARTPFAPTTVMAGDRRSPVDPRAMIDGSPIQPLTAAVRRFSAVAQAGAAGSILGRLEAGAPAASAGPGSAGRPAP